VNEEPGKAAFELVRTFIAAMTPPPGQSLTEAEVLAVVQSHVRIDRIAAAVLRSSWQASTSAQRERICSALLALVSRLMAQPFEAQPASTQLLPFKGGPDRLRVEVSADQLRNGVTVRLSWRVANEGDGPFIYDAANEGISIVESLRSQFGNVLRREGLDGLVTRLESAAG
jgi:ABC-type transporter MlaC component